MISNNDFYVGCSKSEQLRGQEDKPFRKRARRVRLNDLEDFQNQLAKLKKSEIICESRGPYASPIVVVRKKNRLL